MKCVTLATCAMRYPNCIMAPLSRRVAATATNEVIYLRSVSCGLMKRVLFWSLMKECFLIPLPDPVLAICGTTFTCDGPGAPSPTSSRESDPPNLTGSTYAVKKVLVSLSANAALWPLSCSIFAGTVQKECIWHVPIAKQLNFPFLAWNANMRTACIRNVRQLTMQWSLPGETGAPFSNPEKGLTMANHAHVAERGLCHDCDRVSLARERTAWFLYEFRKRYYERITSSVWFV